MDEEKRGSDRKAARTKKMKKKQEPEKEKKEIYKYSR